MNSTQPELARFAKLAREFESAQGSIIKRLRDGAQTASSVANKMNLDVNVPECKAVLNSFRDGARIAVTSRSYRDAFTSAFDSEFTLSVVCLGQSWEVPSVFLSGSTRDIASFVRKTLRAAKVEALELELAAAKRDLLAAKRAQGPELKSVLAEIQAEAEEKTKARQQSPPLLP